MYLGKIVEIGTDDEIYEQPDAPVHPGAAVGGAGARPGRRASTRERIVLAGDVPSPGRPAVGLPLPHPLLEGAGHLRRRGAALDPAGSGPPPVAPATSPNSAQPPRLTAPDPAVDHEVIALLADVSGSSFMINGELGLVEEVAGAGQVHRHAGRLGRVDRPPRRGSSRPAARWRGTPASIRICEPVGEREERVRRGDRAAGPVAAGPRDREPRTSRPG